MNEMTVSSPMRRQIAKLKRVISTCSAWASRYGRVVRGLFPLTWMSFVALVLIYFVWYWEVMAHANQVLHAAVLVWLFFVAVLLVFTVLGSACVYAATRRANRGQTIVEKNEVGGYIASSYRVFRPVFLPFITVECSLLESEMGLNRREKPAFLWFEETLVPRGRGRFSALHRHIVVSDIFGMTAISFTLKQDVDIEITPEKASFEQMVFQTTSSGEDGYSHPSGDPRGDLVEMRRYQAGDPLRLVLWKVFARSRKLVVRTPEPTITQQTELFVYFIAGAHDESSAALARAFLAVEGVDTANMAFSVSGAGRLAQNEAEGVSDIIDSVTHRSQPCDLLDIAPTVDRSVLGQTFILVPNRLGPWIEAARSFAAQYQISPTFVVSSDSRQAATQPQHDSFVRRLFCTTQTNSENDAKETQRLYEQLQSIGTVKSVDIATGAVCDIAAPPRRQTAAKGALT